MLKLWSLLFFVLLAGLGPAVPYGSAQADAPAAAEEEEEAEEAEPPPSKKKSKSKAKPDTMKIRLADIARVHKAQLAFGSAAADEWKKFWTKLRDERGLFEVRLGKQRSGFMDSLRSLDSKDHGQSLLDFENMQTNVMKSFEDNQAAMIREFVADRENRLKEFGAAQEAERARMAQDSLQAWNEERSELKIELPDKKGKKKKDKK